jgi:hypothetical protein
MVGSGAMKRLPNNPYATRAAARQAFKIAAAPIVVSVHRLDQHVEALGVGIRDLDLSIFVNAN